MEYGSFLRAAVGPAYLAPLARLKSPPKRGSAREPVVAISTDMAAETARLPEGEALQERVRPCRIPSKHRKVTHES